MFKKHYQVFAVVFLILGSLLNACTGATPVPPIATEAPPTSIPPTETVSLTETLAPPTLTPLPPTATLPPATATPTTELIELNPSPRGYMSIAYDSESKQVILYGGATGNASQMSDETWAFDVNTLTWTETKPSESPGPGAAGELVYDSESDRIILFGLTSHGITPSTATWAYDYNTNTWTKMKALGPGHHLGSQMAYDAESDRVILFGGWEIGTSYNDTWAYDYNSDTWTQMKPKICPPGQNYHAMTYNAKADRIIMWAGDIGEDDPSIIVHKDSSVWAYDFNTDTWQQKKTDRAPGPRSYHRIAYSDHADLIFLYGGFSTGTTDARTYNYRTNTWKSMPMPKRLPGSLSRFAMAYIPDKDQFVVFGGQLGSRDYNYTNRTWIYDLNTNTWTEVTRNP